MRRYLPLLAAFVSTAMAADIPIREVILYKSGVGRWRPYEQWLDPLKAALGDVLTCYPAAPKCNERPSHGGAQWRLSTEVRLTASSAWASAASQAPASK